ncbi:protein Skeletor, isoforms B/C-like [Haemaphysalis longicornis]
MINISAKCTYSRLAVERVPENLELKRKTNIGVLGAVEVVVAAWRATTQSEVVSYFSSEVLKAYNNANIVITLPKKITDYDYIGIYCVQFNHNFGEVFLPPGFELPAEQKLGGLVGTQNGVKASEVTLKDSITIELKEFYYDGKGTDVHFTVGPTKDARKDQLTKLLDEQGRDTNLGAYSGKTVTMTLPKGHYWNDYQWFAVYSFQSSASFGGLEITKAKSESLPVHAPPDAPTPSNQLSKHHFQTLLQQIKVNVY